LKLEKLRKRQDFLAANGGRRWSAPGFVLLARERSAKANAKTGNGPDTGQAEPGATPGAPPPPGGAEPISPSPAGQPDPGPPRVGFTVTKRVGTSVVRNRLKRRLRALAREVLAPRAAQGTDYVLIGRSGGLTRSYSDMVSDLERAMRKLARH